MMDIVPFAVKQIISIETAIIVIYIIAAIGAGIIGGLATQVGSLRNLFRLTASETDKRSYNTSKERNIAPDNP